MVNVKGNTAEFSFYRPSATKVSIAGDFTGWQPELPMRRSADGHWTARVRLNGGVHKFRYYADGRWYTDYAAFGLEPGPMGLDSVIRIHATSTVLTLPATASRRAKGA